jgi:predicted Zn-dependent protease
MKKIFNLAFLITAVFMFCSLKVSAAETVLKDTVSTEKELARVTAIGQKILSANGLPTQVKFFVSSEEEVNAYANIDNEIHVYRGLLNLVENDEELASVIAHETAHIVNRHMQKQTIIGVVTQSVVAAIKKPFASKVANGVGTLSMLKMSRSAEYEADLTGVDLLVGAGYNPQSMLSLLNKIAQNYIDVIQTHPSGNKRLQNVYDYISFNYPDKLKKDYNTQSYQNFKVYIDSVVKERNANPQKKAEYIQKQTKLRDEKIKRAQKIKKETNPWGLAYRVLETSAQFTK